MTESFVPLVHLCRGDAVESVHFGVVAVSDEHGNLESCWGDPRQQIVLRSAGKPFQAATFVESGLADDLRVDDRELAIIVGSHGGAPEHVDVVQSLLRKTGVDQRQLKCGIHPPFDRAARTLSRRRGASVLQNNCSAKHIAMLAGAIGGEHPLETYLHASHPWQRRVREQFAEAAGLGPGEVETVTDGCGAPSFVLPAAAAARAYAALASSSTGSLARIWDAATGHPRMIAGQGRLETALMELFPGRVLAKSGAEGIYALAVRVDGGSRGALIKIADGDDTRARPATAIAVAAALLEMTANEVAALRRDHVPSVRTLSGTPVGEVRTLIR